MFNIFTGSYRGMRRIQGLPYKGRTHANSKTPRFLKKQGKNFPFNLNRNSTHITRKTQKVKNKKNSKNLDKNNKNLAKKNKKKSKK